MKATIKRCASCGGGGLAQSHPGACWQCLGTGRMRPNLPSNQEMEHPMPCAKCRKPFDAWGYTLSQRTRGPWRGLCSPCREAALLEGIRDHRSCFDCDHNYCGGIECPACGNASGEPLNR